MMRELQTVRAIRAPSAATRTVDPLRSKRGELEAAVMSEGGDPRHHSRSVRSARDPWRSAPCLRAESRVWCRHLAHRCASERTRGCPMSEPITGPGSDHLSRRTFLRAAGVTGAAALGPAVLRSRAEAQETPSPVRPDAAAKRGGTLRYGVLSAPAHFDVHQSGTVSNIGAQSPMYDCLIRRDPRDGQTVIPDLASKWDIAPDGKKYTFYLRKGVKFHDGAELTSADVKATYERIVRPPKGIVIPRTPLFAAVGEIVAVDPNRIEF